MFNMLYSLISFVVALFFILFGIIGLILPWSAGVRTDLIQFILENTLAISIFGFGFVIIGSTLVINLVQNLKKNHYYIRSDKQLVVIDEALLQQYLNSYMKDLFPDHEIPARLTVKKNKIKITADLPYTPLPQQELFINRMRHDLDEILKRILGYSNEFVLSISFSNK
jgi:hypothetical protein